MKKCDFSLENEKKAVLTQKLASAAPPGDFFISQ